MILKASLRNIYWNAHDKKIISGGQTGVDQAALTVAKELGIAIGGWCPRGGLDETDCDIRRIYSSLRATKTKNPDDRTRLNIDSADATLIVVPSVPLSANIKDGTILTIEYAQVQKKPYLLMPLDVPVALVQFKNWLARNEISILNVGGPRESSVPGINKQATEFLREYFKD